MSLPARRERAASLMISETELRMPSSCHSCLKCMDFCEGNDFAPPLFTETIALLFKRKGQYPTEKGLLVSKALH